MLVASFGAIVCAASAGRLQTVDGRPQTADGLSEVGLECDGRALGGSITCSSPHP
jgi:hypothetical protein